MEWSKYNYLFYSQKISSYILYSALSNMMIELDEEEYQEVNELRNFPQKIDLKEENHKILYDGRFFVESNETEQNKIILSTLLKRFDNTRLNLTIAPTRSCNFDCVYCYEEDRQNITMNKKVQTGLIDFIKKQNNIKSIGVCWYGGEPTLAIPVIRNLTKQMTKLLPEYSAMMVTNGYCLDKVVDELDELKIKNIQITLDGTRDTHNSRRMLKNGGDTFDKIFVNLQKLVLNKNVKVAVRMNVDDSNAQEYVELLRYCQKELNSGNINLYPGFVHNASNNCKVESCYEDSVQKAAFIKKVFETDSIYIGEIYPFRTDKACISNIQNGFLVGPKGELYKCWHHLGQKSKEIGTVFGNTIENKNIFTDSMLKNDCLFNKKCTDCLLFPSCSCGCPDMRQQGINQCIPAKSMLEDFLEIHYAVKIFQSQKS
ncbi:MAG: radical SAM protein [Dysgonamonadaceae bacterium]|nr:radical SAM protein [Dysgonamonadaceae bacterium]